MSRTDNGNVLRVTKSSPNVHLDWSLDTTSGPFVLKRSLSFTFSNALYLGPGQTTKTFDDAVLNNTQNYAYEAFRRTLTDTLYFYHADHLGTPIAMTNDAGALVWRAEHTPFGGIYALTVGTIPNNLRFPGQYYDAETGLAQNFWRDYSGATGRYRQADPKGVVFGEKNRYLYSFANPVGRIDPKGLTSYSAFPSDKEGQMRQAVEEAKAKLREHPCCLGSEGPRLLGLLEKATYTYTEDLKYPFSGDPLCGYVGPLDWVWNRIEIGHLAFDPAACGPLHCTVLHEAIHLRLFNAGEGPAYEAEKKCFGCGS